MPGENVDQITNSYFEEYLADLEGKSLRRTLRNVTGPQGPEICIDGKTLLNFCSNDYLGLAGDPRLSDAAATCMKQEGFGSGASRLVCGNMSAHERLERALAAFKDTEQCLLFSTGYMANIGIITGVFGPGDMIFSDRLNHASIIDGVRLSGAKWKRYAHSDMDSLEKMLKSTPGFRKRGIITDSVFSMDGDCAQLKDIVALAKKYDCLVMVDEAHAFGVMGASGRGLAEHCGVENEIDIQMGTLSKAAGAFGAYCCGDRSLVNYLINTARSFIYTTGMPPSVAAAALKAVSLIRDEPGLRERLWENTRYMRAALNQLGFNTGASETPIIPVFVGDSPMALRFSRLLMAEGLYVTPIRPPTVPMGTARLRITVTAAHQQQHLDLALERLQKTGRELCLI